MNCIGMYSAAIAVILLLWSIGIASAKQCGENQKKRLDSSNNPICCLTVICEQGSNQIPKPCAFDGGTDTCVNCPDNTCNLARINSLYFDDFSYLCRHVDILCDTSTLGGTLPYINSTTCEVTCKCDRLRGFYNYNPHFKDCQKGDTTCPDKTTWLNDSGQCEECDDGFFQEDKFGECSSLNQPLDQPSTQQVNSEKTSTAPTTEVNIIANTTAAEQEGSNLVPVYVGGSIAFVVVVIIVVFGIFYLRPRTGDDREEGHRNMRQAEEDLGLRRLSRSDTLQLHEPLLGDSRNSRVPHANGAPPNVNGAVGGTVSANNVSATNGASSRITSGVLPNVNEAVGGTVAGSNVLATNGASSRITNGASNRNNGVPPDVNVASSSTVAGNNVSAPNEASGGTADGDHLAPINDAANEIDADAVHLSDDSD